MAKVTLRTRYRLRGKVVGEPGDVVDAPAAVAKRLKAAKIAEGGRPGDPEPSPKPETPKRGQTRAWGDHGAMDTISAGM